MMEQIDLRVSPFGLVPRLELVSTTHWHGARICPNVGTLVTLRSP